MSESLYPPYNYNKKIIPKKSNNIHKIVNFCNKHKCEYNKFGFILYLTPMERRFYFLKLKMEIFLNKYTSRYRFRKFKKYNWYKY
jgi:hypothetical protein